MATLLHEMKRRGKDCRFGVISMCIGITFSFLSNLCQMCSALCTEYNGCCHLEQALEWGQLLFLREVHMLMSLPMPEKSVTTIFYLRMLDRDLHIKIS